MRKATALAISMLFIFMLIPTAWAHPFIDKTEPARLSSALVGIDSVTVWYSEGIEIDFSSLKVFDSAGNRVDNSDTSYYEDDTSLRVTTSMLEEGVYTVSGRTLSRIDGHLVSEAFIFAVGGATIAATDIQSVIPTAQIFVTESLAKFPGLVGQTIVLGASIALLFSWSMRRMFGTTDEAETVHNSKFMTLVGAGIVLVLASDIFMMASHVFTLETHILDAFGTVFGGTMLIRFAITAVLVCLWFAIEKRNSVTPRCALVFATFGLGLAATSTMIGHGAATETMAPIVLDYIHNVIAAVWIGGVAYLLIVMLPFLLKIGQKANIATLVIVPTFSAVFVACVGIAAITGPLLLWLLEDSVELITNSTYGTLLFIKIILGSSMVLVGAYNWRITSRRAMKSITSRLGKSLRIELCLGFGLLILVSLLTNTTLPGGEAQATITSVPKGLDITEFSSGAAFDVSIWPLAVGSNTITVLVTDPNGQRIDDIKNLNVIISSVEQNIAPITTSLAIDGQGYTGEFTLGFWGKWDIMIEAVRTEAINESVNIRKTVKPRLADLSFELKEFELPSEASPLYVDHDGAYTIWISDPASPRLWSFDTLYEEFTEYGYDGKGSVTLDIDEQGLVWFTDLQLSSIGSFNPQTGEFEIIAIPDFGDASIVAFPVWIHADNDGIIWTSVPNKNAILSYDTQTHEFTKHMSLTFESAPFAIIKNESGDIWFTQQSGTSIGRLSGSTGQMDEISVDISLKNSETISFDSDGDVWVSEHYEGGSIAHIDLKSGISERISVPDSGALPNSVSFDKYDNAWFALHTVDSIAVYDKSSGELAEIDIPTLNSWIQFTVSDPDGNIWFAEQRPSKLGVILVSEPSFVIYEKPQDSVPISFAQIAAPLMGLVMIGASLFIVKAVHKRREMIAEFKN